VLIVDDHADFRTFARALLLADGRRRRTVVLACAHDVASIPSSVTRPPR
jgi:hypothetical protein